MQLVLDFPVNTRYSFDNFVLCSGNRTAYRFAKMLLEENGGNILYLYGPSGSGKTHLLSAVGSCFQGCGKEPVSWISFGALPHSIEEFRQEGMYQPAEILSRSQLLLVDDIHLMPDDDAIRRWTWQLFNDYHSAGKKMVITGRVPPREIRTLDDHLASRLLWGLSAGMDVSDDDSRRMILRKLAKDRQVLVPDTVIDYLIFHTDRDIPPLITAFDAVVNEAFSSKRKVSLRLAREALLPPAQE